MIQFKMSFVELNFRWICWSIPFSLIAQLSQRFHVFVAYFNTVNMHIYFFYIYSNIIAIILSSNFIAYAYRVKLML